VVRYIFFSYRPMLNIDVRLHHTFLHRIEREAVQRYSHDIHQRLMKVERLFPVPGALVQCHTIYRQTINSYVIYHLPVKYSQQCHIPSTGKLFTAMSYHLPVNYQQQCHTPSTGKLSTAMSYYLPVNYQQQCHIPSTGKLFTAMSYTIYR